MDTLLTGDAGVAVAAFAAGLVVAGIVWGSKALVGYFKSTPNKLDDTLIEPLEKIAEALDSKEAAPKSE